ncbi:MAG: hypothetical protein WDN26_19365 [Chitinophagaceae bacterium]
MKKNTPQPRKEIINAHASVAATFEEFWFVEKLVEELADKADGNTEHIEIESAAPEWEAIETSSMTAPVCGNLFLSDDNKMIKAFFISSFMFTCIRENNGMKLSWSNSLS